jgi:phage terminase large subunit GpA-like protein
MKAETEAGRLVRGYYSCEKCHDAIFNHDKTIMLAQGEWVPTAVSIDKYTRSYHDSQLYRPVGMFDWTSMVADYQKSKDDPELMRSFTNLRLGLPFKEDGARPDTDKIIELRGTYKSHEVPDGVLFITAAVDVQTGSATDKKNPPRLEMEICGHGDRFRTWSIAYHRFEGSIDDIDDGAWKMLTDFTEGGGFDLSRSDGRVFGTVMVLIDSGDGNTMDTVYDYCRDRQNFHPSKGAKILKGKQKEKGDEESAADSQKYRLKPLDEDNFLVVIATNYYKKNVYRNIKIPRQMTGKQTSGFCDFPRDYGTKYFKMLTAEEMHADGSFHSGGRRNEALDVRVYNLCAAHLYLNALVQDFKATAKMRAREKKQNLSPMDLQKINHRYALDRLTDMTRRRIDGSPTED